MLPKLLSQRYDVGSSPATAGVSGKRLINAFTVLTARFTEAAKEPEPGGPMSERKVLSSAQRVRGRRSSSRSHGTWQQASRPGRRQ